MIPDLESLLAGYLGAGRTVVSHTTKNLIAPGENYGSVMLALEVKVRDADQKEQVLHLVAKLCPPNELIKHMFNIPVTFKKEVEFYRTVLPTLQAFQRERGCCKVMDFFPKYCGSRYSLDPNKDEVDDDACLILENIKVKGFDIEERMVGFNLDAAEFIIKDLAEFHAVPIALKMVHPDVFQTKIMPHITNHLTEPPQEATEGMLNGILDGAKLHPECTKYVDRLRMAITKNQDIYRNGWEIREPFATISHSDFWVNNTMIKKDKNGKVVANAMVDFQLSLYSSALDDLMFFIYSSLSVDIIKEHYDHLVGLYYKTFIGVLNELKVDTKAFSREIFMEEINKCVPGMQCFHILFMLKPIFSNKETAKDLSELDESVFSDFSDINDLYYAKLWATILDFVDKKWI